MTDGRGADTVSVGDSDPAMRGDLEAQSQVWSEVLDELAQSAKAERIARWFSATELLEQSDDRWVVGVPNRFIREWIEQRYLPTLEQIVRNRYGVEELRLKVDGELYRQFRKDESDFLAHETPVVPAGQRTGSSTEPTRAQPTRAPGERSKKSDATLNKNFTLDSFIVASCNHVAYNAGLEVLQQPGGAYNPLFVYGGCGLGKTHLLQALAREYFRQGHREIRYLPCESFTNLFIRSVRDGKIEEFRSKFQKLTALVLDDVQGLQNKTKTQEELLHIVDHIASNGGQVILASDARPQGVVGLQKPLESRFLSGLVCKVEPPDYPTRVAILQRESRKLEVALDDSILHRVAELCHRNVRELIGAFVRVVAFGSLVNEPLTEARVAAILEEEHYQERRGINMQRIAEVVAQHTGHQVAELISRRRGRSLSDSRQIAIYLSRSLTDHSLAEIGTFYGGRNHATVNFSFRKVLARLQSERGLQREMDSLLERLRS